MFVSVTPEQMVEAFQRTFPKEYEIAALRLVNELQSRRIAELEKLLKDNEIEVNTEG